MKGKDFALWQNFKDPVQSQKQPWDFAPLRLSFLPCVLLSTLRDGAAVNPFVSLCFLCCPSGHPSCPETKGLAADQSKPVYPETLPTLRLLSDLCIYFPNVYDILEWILATF